MKDLYLSQWQNHIDEDREQQPQVVLQLRRCRGALSCWSGQQGGLSNRVCGEVASLVVGACNSAAAHGRHMPASMYHASFLKTIGWQSVKRPTTEVLVRIFLMIKEHFNLIPECLVKLFTN
jgi:hypothetical protein